MKKYLLLILLLFISINVYAEVPENVFCIGNECITKGTGNQTLSVNGTTGTATVDLNTNKIIFDGFNNTVGNDNLYLYQTYTSSDYLSYIYTNINDNFNIELKGNNKIIVDDLGALTKYDYYINIFNFISSDTRNITINGVANNVKFDFEMESQTSSKEIMTSIFNFGKDNSYFDNFKSEVIYKEIARSSLRVAETSAILNITDCYFDVFIGNSFYLSKVFYSSNISINNSTIKAKGAKRTNACLIGSNNVNIVESTIEFDVENSEQNRLIGYDGTNDCSFKFKDSSLYANNVAYGLYYYVDDLDIYNGASYYHSTIEFDNTNLNIFATDYAIYSHYSYNHPMVQMEEEIIPTITFKNYNDKKVAVYKKNTENNMFEYMLYNNAVTSPELFNSFTKIKTVVDGEVKTNIVNVNEYYDLTEKDQNYIQVGYDITLSITQEIFNPTESIINLVNTKKGDNEVLEYFDINFIKEVNEVKTNITELKKEIEIKIPLQDSYKKDNRTYKVLRIHENEIDELNTEIKGDFIVFKTDKFSTYVLTYSDIINNPKTGDSLTNNIIIAIISLIVFAIILIVYKRKK